MRWTFQGINGRTKSSCQWSKKLYPQLLPVSLSWRSFYTIQLSHHLYSARCNLGIFPIELPDGSLSFDSSHYYMLERDGRSVLECIRRDRVGNSYVGPGGRVITGKILLCTLNLAALISLQAGSTASRSSFTSPARSGIFRCSKPKLRTDQYTSPSTLPATRL